MQNKYNHRNFVHLVGLYTYCRTKHGAYNVKLNAVWTWVVSWRPQPFGTTVTTSFRGTPRGCDALWGKSWKRERFWPSYDRHYGDRDSSVGIATRYGLDGPGIESRWGGEIFRTGPRAHPASYIIGTGSFPGVKRPGRGVHNTPPCSTEVKEEVELYLYSTSEPSWPAVGWNLLYFTLLYDSHYDDYSLPGRRAL